MKPSLLTYIKSLSRNLLYASILIGVVSCNNDSNDEMPRMVTAEDVERDFNQIPLQPGVQDIQLEVQTGQFWNFRVIMPDVDFSQDWPLVMGFHGASGGSPTAHQTTECYIEPGLEDLDAFVIHPNAGNLEWYDPPNQSMVQGLLQLAAKFWPVDLERVVATGYSNGGNASWLFAELAPNIFSAGIPMASSYDLTNMDGSGRKIEIPMYVIHGENDELFPIEITKNWVDLSIQAGSDITFVVAAGLTHFEPCSYSPYLKEAVNWLKETVWK